MSLFLKQFWASPRSIGAVMPSSLALADAMVAPIDFSGGPVVVEFGPGTGAITRAIAPRLTPDSRYLAIELNLAFCHRLQADFPALSIVEGSVEHVAAIAAAHGIARIDAIICGLPWASLPQSLQRTVFAEIDRLLVPGGLFVTFAYVQGLALPGARALRHSLRRHFESVTRSRIVWGNVPPAFAYICRKSP